MDWSDDLREVDGNLIFRSKHRCIKVRPIEHTFNVAVFKLVGNLKSSFCW